MALVTADEGKQISSRTGIYEIRNISNGKRYIGSAVNLRRRFICHLYDLRHSIHANDHLQKAWNKYGEANFGFKILLYCDKENLLFYEQRAIAVFNMVYNICLVAGSALGVKRSEEFKKKISKTLKGRLKVKGGCYG